MRKYNNVVDAFFLTSPDTISVTAGPPPPRPWIPLVENFKPTKPTALFTVSFNLSAVGQFQVRTIPINLHFRLPQVMCYNVLCDRYATKQMYGYCPHWALNWEYRKKGILDEVRHYR